MMLLLGKLGTEMTPLVSLPFASMEADVRRTAGCKVQILPAGLACSDYRGEAVHTRPDMRWGYVCSPAPASGAHFTPLRVHLVERLGGN
jgi:hypothetical protein